MAQPSEQATGEPPSARAAGASGADDAVLPVAVGTLAWAIALVVLLLVRDRLRHSGDGWWIWVAVTGLALGVLGSVWVRRRRAVHRRADPRAP